VKILVTGSAGFIGFHLSKRLLELEPIVVGLDNLNDYYDVSLKKARLEQLKQENLFSFHKIDLCDRCKINELFTLCQFDIVVNLAAQAGVRHSLTNPYTYIDSNLVGFINIIECCRKSNVKHFIFASSSSVYGANTKLPFSVYDNVDQPISLYGATKKANELIAHTYSHLYNLPTTGLRFFTVYGPWGRPDMALFLFTKAILEGNPINVFNNGQMKRDFTYIDDIVEVVVRVMNKIPQSNSNCLRERQNPSSSHAPYKIYNIGNNHPVELMKFIELIENSLGKRVPKIMLPVQSCEVTQTYADMDDLFEDIGFTPNTSIEAGITNFIKWYKSYYS